MSNEYQIHFVMFMDNWKNSGTPSVSTTWFQRPKACDTLRSLLWGWYATARI